MIGTDNTLHLMVPLRTYRTRHALSFSWNRLRMVLLESGMFDHKQQISVKCDK